MTSIRVERVQDLIREIIGELILKLKDPRIGFVTITRVKVSPDLRNAQIFVSVLGTEDDARRSMEALDSAAGYLRTQVAKEARLRYAPSLLFTLDATTKKAMEVIALLNQIKEKESDKPAQNEETA